MKTSLASASIGAVIICTMTALAPTASVHAQTVDQETVTENEAVVENKEIIVTARKRDESLQDVPISIAVISNSAISNAAVTSLVQIESVVPGLNLAKAPTGNSVGVTIRGLGSAPGDPSFESSVSLFVDGIYAPRSREFSSALFDIQRLEVIKGTQAALLGKNTSLGALNVITRKPSDVFSLNGRVAYDLELGSRTFEMGVDIPIADTLRVRVAGQSTYESGWVLNTISNKRGQRNYNDAIRVTTVWEPVDSIDITGSYQYGKVRSSGSVAELISANPTAQFLQAQAGAPGTLDFTLNRRNASSLGALGTEPEDNIRSHRGSLVINAGLGNHTLTSVTGYSRYRNLESSDTDLLAGEYLTRDVNELSKQFSQEVRIVSPSDGRFDYVIGGTYIQNRLQSDYIAAAAYPFGVATGAPPIAGEFNNLFYQKSDTISGFLQTSFDLTDALRLQGGLRYTNEKKKATLSRNATIPGFFSTVLYPQFLTPITPSKNENNLDYSVGAQFDVTETIMAYASYGQGTKAGGFASSVTNLSQSPYNSERARTFEVGFKAQDASSRFTVNAAAFNSDVKNFQVVTFNGQAFIVTNANLRSRGVEGEMAWTPENGFRLFANATYADVKDKGTGFDIPLAPRFSGNAGLSLTRDIVGSGLIGIIDGSVTHRSSRSYQQDPNVPRGGAFTTLNMSAAVGSQDEKWELRLIGRNMTNANEAAFVFPTPIIGGYAGVSERPRTVTLQFSVKM